MRPCALLVLVLLTACPEKPIPRPERYEHAPTEVRGKGTRLTFESFRAEALPVGGVDVLHRAGLTGKGLTLAVVDTGLNTMHREFRNAGNRIVSRVNYSGIGSPSDVEDADGHGSHVTGIAAGRNGVAPKASMAVLKASHEGGATFDVVEQALDWVLKNPTGIVVVNISGADRNFSSDGGFSTDSIRLQIEQLRKQGIAVVASAGNQFYKSNSTEGMGFPAICRETISVGAVYDADVGRREHNDGSKACTTGKRRYVPMSQRLHGGNVRTDIFAPGGVLKSADKGPDTAVAYLTGTSQAAPYISGLVLLLQEHALKEHKRLATVDQIEESLFEGAVQLEDGDDEDDNVTNTNKRYPVVNAVGARRKLDQKMKPSLFIRFLRALGFR
jgi:subtilisin family serine protease